MSQPRVTEFQSRVYAVLRRVPKGRVTTYRALAQAVGCGSCQAIGQALKRNPFAPRIPCHRVIGSDLKIGGFMGRGDGAAVGKKRRLLADEGVTFKGGRLAEPDRVLYAL